jgi:hypothetical protein
MGFRFRRSARLGPLRFNFAKGGLSSISVGGRGASFNIPGSRSGGPHTTVGLPGTGLSWSVEHTPYRSTALSAGPATGLPNSRRLRPGQLNAFKQSLLGVLRQELFVAGSAGEQLWEHGLVSRLLADASIGARTTGLLVLIETPEAMEGYLLRAQGQDDAKRLHHGRAGGLTPGRLQRVAGDRLKAWINLIPTPWHERPSATSGRQQRWGSS